MVISPHARRPRGGAQRRGTGRVGKVAARAVTVARAKRAVAAFRTSFGAQFIGDNRCRALPQLPQRSRNNHIML